jgi:hypothetical protein
MSIDIRPSFRLGDDFDDESIPSLNMSNGNAHTVLAALGFTADAIETIASEGIDLTPLDLSSRLILAGVFPEMVQDRAPERIGNWIDNGTSREYITDRLNVIRDIVAWADQRGREVSIY